MKTTYETHMNDAVAEGLSILKSERGLAKNLFLGAKLLVQSIGMDNIVGEWESEMNKAEAKIRGELPEGKTLSECVKAYRMRKSEVKRCLKAGVDPTKYDSLNAWLKEVKKDNTATDNSGDATTTDTSKSDNKASTPSKLQVAESKLPKETREALAKMVALLPSLSAEDQATILSNCTGAIHAKIRKAGGQFAGVKKTG